MCRAQSVLLVALFIGLAIAYPWDIAVSVGDRLEFYTNGTKTDTVHIKSHNPTAIAYDEIHNMMLFVDKQGNNDAICGYNFASTDIKCFIKRVGSNIQHLAFDPATDLLFFTDIKEGTINWISLKDQRSEDNVYGNVLIKLEDRIPSDIAVDSCRGYIYWSYKSDNYHSKYMERARFSGSERKIIYDWMPVYCFTIDPQTHTKYYIDGYESHQCAYYLKIDLREEDLNGQNAVLIYYGGVYSASPPKELTVSNDYLYWMNSSTSHTTVWQRPKHPDAYYDVEHKEFLKFYSERPLGIAAYYKIKEQVQGLQDCEALSSLIPKITVTNNTRNTEQAKQKPRASQNNLTTEMDKKTETEVIPETEQTIEYKTEVELTCAHGIKVNKTSVCKCTPGYTGERCDVSVCEKFCLHGNLSFNNEELPKCRCDAGCTDQHVVGGTDKTQCATTNTVAHSAAGRGISSPLSYASQFYVSLFVVYIRTLHLLFTK